ILTATILKDKEILGLLVHAIRDKVKENEQNDESITFDELATGQPKYAGQLAARFKSAYLALLKEGNYFLSTEFANLPGGEPSGRIKPGNMPVYDDVFFNNDAAQIYFPYSELFAAVDIAGFDVTYHPLKEVEENEAFKSLGGKQNSLETIIVNEDHAQKYPVLVINFDEEDNQSQLILDPPPPAYLCNFLTYNTFSDVLDDRYVITATIPKIKILKNFRSFIGGANYITMYQCYAKPDNFNVNTSPALNPITADKRIVVTDFKIKRANKGKWVDFGQIFNDDWRLVQYDNPMILFSKQGWFYNPSGNLEVKVSGGVKLDTVHIDKTRPYEPDSIRYQWTSGFSAGASLTFNLRIGSQYQLIGSDYVSRRGLLASCVGDNFGTGTAGEAGESTPWTVRKVSDAMLYYFKIRECHQ
ncbi:MAG: hypothetical protein ABI688_10775, partial [Bacteroidota bacterium]